MEIPNFIFSSGKIELKEEGNNLFVEGYVSTSDLDLVNDVVSKGCILDMSEQMRSRNIKFDVEHESFRGKSDLDMQLNKTLIPVAKVDDFVVDKKGLKVRAVLNKHSKRFDEVKGSIQDGFLDAFSIAFIPVSVSSEMKDGKEIRLLDKINLLNVAFTGNPINTEATMTNVFMKSLDYLKDKEVTHDHKSDNLTTEKEVLKMSEKDKKETESETEEEEESEESEAEETEAKSKTEGKDEAEEAKEESKEEEAEEETKSEDEDEDDESNDESDKSDKSDVDAKSRISALEKEMTEVRAILKRPLLKSKVSQKDKKDQFVEEKAKSPLDMIA